MNDRELLELAAKAAGLTDTTYFEMSGDEPALHVKSYGLWDPLGDDGDALRLANKLGLCVSHWSRHVPPDVMVVYPTGADSGSNLTEEYGADPDAATRRAIVRAAAEIGAGMRPFPTVEEIHQMVGTEGQS